MRKIVALILIVSMFLPEFACANTANLYKVRLNIKSMTLEELYEANEAIQQLIFSKEAVNGISVPSGIYKIGTDIPSGVYRLEFPTLTEYTSGYVMSYENGLDDIPLFSYLIGELIGVTSIGKVELTDGMLLDIHNCEPVFYTYTGLFH